MPSSKILLTGKYYSNNVDVRIIPSSLHLTNKVLQDIDLLWEAVLQDAKKEKRRIYNGICYRLEDVISEENRLFLTFSEIEYKIRYCLPKIQTVHSFEAKSCFTAGTIRTCDGKYLLVELSGKSMNLNDKDLVGGMLEKQNLLEHGDDLFGQYYIEITEEIAVHQKDITENYLRSIYQTDKGNIGFYFETVLSLSAEEVQQRFKENVHDQDIKHLCILSKEEYREFLLQYNENKKLISQVNLV